ncbi:hypothetical protein AYO38_03870 [bacterium SCGC AG-212-C10]|nr:hypothetical protein AYO38_03870 [bacterium SCGC AG-212-C10]
MSDLLIRRFPGEASATLKSQSEADVSLQALLMEILDEEAARAKRLEDFRAWSEAFREETSSGAALTDGTFLRHIGRHR